jgi:hypothetical protein
MIGITQSRSITSMFPTADNLSTTPRMIIVVMVKFFKETTLLV